MRLNQNTSLKLLKEREREYLKKQKKKKKLMIQWTNVVRIPAGIEIISAKSLSVSSFAA